MKNNDTVYSYTDSVQGAKPMYSGDSKYLAFNVCMALDPDFQSFETGTE